MRMKERLRVRCEEDFYKKLEKAAETKKKTVSDLVRWILKNWLKRNKIK